MVDRAKDPDPRPPRVRAVPWKTPLAERTKAALGEAPAYIRRARNLERNIDLLFARAEKRHEGIMRFVALRQREGRSEAVVRGTIERCNARWRKWVEAEDRFTRINAEIAAYNENYPDERQAALKHVPLDQVTFEPRDPIGPDDLYARFPLATATA